MSKVKRYKPGVLVTGYDPSIKCWMDNACAGHVHRIMSRATKGPFDVYHQKVECLNCGRLREQVLVRWVRQKADTEYIEAALAHLKGEQVRLGASESILKIALRKIQS